MEDAVGSAASGEASSVFGDIYRRAAWGDAQRSGPGSAPAAVRAYSDLLVRFIREQRIRTVVDVGCGDWSFSRLIDWGTATYVGVDVVPELISSHQARYGNERVSFVLADASMTALPAGELLIMKDVLQHWPNRSILDFLPRLTAYRWAIITNDRDRYYRRGWRQLWRPARPDVPNADAPFGGYRPVRLRDSPFDLDATELTRFRVKVGDEIRDTKEVLLWKNPGGVGPLPFGR